MEPVLGTIETSERQAVVADIPGLIEGAAAGAGLGHEFLAHVERCAVLVHLVEIAPDPGDPVAAYETVRRELSSHGAGLDQVPEIVVLSKSDLLPAEEAERIATDWRARFGEATIGVLPASSATGDGLEELSRLIVASIPEEPAPAPAAGPTDGFEAEHRVYRPAGEGGYDVVAEGEGAFRVNGRGVELLVERHDLGNEEALSYLEQRLTEIGVVAALRSAGFEPGDEVRIGEHEFELHPG